MNPALVKLVSGIVGVGVMALFNLGLSHSISTGFAGFWGGFPFLVIVLVVLAMLVYDFWDECIRDFRRRRG
jgi:sterol desaturase/sphingolipid hydroxylase (fatty acid hydroxylase superfamily)